jgi:uncharacterized protein
VAGIRGSLVVSLDGMVIAAKLTGGLDQDRVAAIACNVVRRTAKTLESYGLGLFSRLTLASSDGKMAFEETGEAYLVVVMGRGIDLGQAELEIRSAANRIRSLGEIHIA